MLFSMEEQWFWNAKALLLASESNALAVQKQCSSRPKAMLRLSETIALALWELCKKPLYCDYKDLSCSMVALTRRAVVRRIESSSAPFAPM